MSIFYNPISSPKEGLLYSNALEFQLSVVNIFIIYYIILSDESFSVFVLLPLPFARRDIFLHVFSRRKINYKICKSSI